MPELTHDAKHLVRRYLLSLFVLPTAILAIIGFLLGWFINEAARGKPMLRHIATLRQKY